MAYMLKYDSTHGMFKGEVEVKDGRIVDAYSSGTMVRGIEIILKGRGRVRDVASGPDGFIYLLLTDGSPRKGRVVRMVPVQ